MPLIKNTKTETAPQHTAQISFIISVDLPPAWNSKAVITLFKVLVYSLL